MATARFGRVDDVHAETLSENILAFGRLLRRAGLRIEPGKSRLFVRVLTIVGVDRRQDVKAAGRAVFAQSRNEGKVYDAAFDLFWRRVGPAGTSDQLPRVRQRDEHRQPDTSLAPDEMNRPPIGDVVDERAPVGSSAREQLRTMDFADMTTEEARDAAALIGAIRTRLPLRPSRRPRVGRRGYRPALRYMLRHAISTGGMSVGWPWLRRTRRPRPIVLVCDISGSMERYTRFMLRFAHAMARAGAPLEVFVFGTRLTRITRELGARHPDAALRNVGSKVVDWSGGTRIGDSLHELNRKWVRRTIRSGAIVLLISDGWERGDPDALGTEVATLQRSCHRLIWLDPLASRPGFEPATLGLRAALPHVDQFLPCATIASLEELAAKLDWNGW